MYRRYLVPTAMARLESAYRTHPLPMVAAVVALFVLILGLLRWKFGRLGTDAVVFAVILTVITVFVLSCLYTLSSMSGIRIA
jgi:hypothetical protein